MKLVIVVQARVGSTRLPAKVLRPVAGRPMLFRMLERLCVVGSSVELAVATTTATEDDAIVQVSKAAGVPCFRGHPTDLLDRHRLVARALRADAIVRIPSDCPLVDPWVVARVIDQYAEHARAFDFMSNLHPPSYPDGNDVEVIPASVLESAWREAKRPYEREHVTPFIWDQPERFRIGNVVWETKLDYSMSHRFTVDYPEDYAFAAAVYDALWEAQRPPFSLLDILDLLKRRPDIRALNSRYVGVNWYRHHIGDLRTIRPCETRDVPRTP